MARDHATTEASAVSGRRITKSVHIGMREPKLNVKCFPPNDSSAFSVVRGETITCQAGLDNGAPFSVDSARATLTFQGIERTITGVMNAAGTQWTSTGKAADATEVFISARSGGLKLSGQGSFGVDARTNFPVPQIRQVPIDSAPFGWTPYALVSFDTLGTIILGKASYEKTRPIPTVFPSNLDSATSGPNSGLSFLDSLPLVATVQINPTFFDTETDPRFSWRADQNGTDGTNSTVGTMNFCTQADIPAILAEVERHEGVTLASDSHLGVVNNAFLTDGIRDEVEKKVMLTSDGVSPWLSWGRAVASKYAVNTQAAQGAFHAGGEENVVQLITSKVGCYPDMNPRNP